MKYFYDRFWDWNKNNRISDLEFKWPAIESLLPRDEKGTILDYGCGQGRILSRVQKLSPKSKIVGMDVSQVALKIAKTSIRGGSFYKVQDGGRLPIKTKSVDFLMCLDVIEHVYDTQMLVQEFSRVLKSNGRVLISTPYYGLVKNIIIALFMFDTIYDPVGPHIRFFSKDSLLRLLEKNNISPTNFGYYGRFYPINNAMYVVGKKQRLPKE